MFSSRVPGDLRVNRLARALAAARDAGMPLVDLTESNPTRVGLSYPADLLEPLADPGGLRYDPQPFGLQAAREAVAAYLGGCGVAVPPDRLVLTASTSEAYSLLFKLLCDPGDRVLVPRPSYPLFEHLTRLDGIDACPYTLEYHGRWDIDVAGLERAVAPRTRAVLLVSPNNPTGSYVSAGELDAVAALCARRGAALIGDEVFAPYPLDGHAARPASVLAHEREVLTFSLGGLSKAVGLPQLKLGWIAVGGPARLVADALSRLELICDTYLSVSTPVQLAAGSLIARGAHLTAEIAGRVRRNRRILQEEALRHPSCHVLRAEGGWYAVVQVPATRPEEDLVVELVDCERVLVHPGYFFDFPREAFLVVSLLGDPEVFRGAVARVLARAS